MVSVVMHDAILRLARGEFTTDLARVWRRLPTECRHDGAAAARAARTVRMHTSRWRSDGHGGWVHVNGLGFQTVALVHGWHRGWVLIKPSGVRLWYPSPAKALRAWAKRRPPC